MKMQKTKEELIIYQKHVDLIMYAYNLLKKYPKSEKGAIVQEIRQNLYSVLELILLANKTYNEGQERLKIMNKIDAKINFQRILVRISHENKYINNSNYMEWERRITEIGRILGGWIKSTCPKE
jgi:four helix bundle protein